MAAETHTHPHRLLFSIIRTHTLLIWIYTSIYLYICTSRNTSKCIRLQKQVLLYLSSSFIFSFPLILGFFSVKTLYRILFLEPLFLSSPSIIITVISPTNQLSLKILCFCGNFGPLRKLDFLSNLIRFQCNRFQALDLFKVLFSRPWKFLDKHSLNIFHRPKQTIVQHDFQPNNHILATAPTLLKSIGNTLLKILEISMDFLLYKGFYHIVEILLVVVTKIRFANY